MDIINTRRLAVIMTCHNRREKTLSCLNALFNQEFETKLNVDVYLVDDGSTDGTSEAVKKDYPDVNILHGDGGLYWNRGMNKAFGRAIEGGYDYYLWLNDDTYLFPNGINHLVETHNKLMLKGISRSIIVGSAQDAETKCHTYGGVKREHVLKPLSLRKTPPGDEPIRCDTANGNCILIPKDVVNKVGNIDTVFQHRWGDHDYGLRASRAGCSIWIAPGYIASCSLNTVEATWEDVTLPIKERIDKLRSIKGIHPKDYMIYVRRHAGIMWMFYWIWPYVKIIFTSLQQRLSGKLKPN